jgi:hypothetical protein
MLRLDDACAKVGRAPSALRRLVLSGPQLDSGLASLESFRDTIARHGAAGVTDFVVHWPRSAAPYAGDLKTFERIIANR